MYIGGSVPDNKESDHGSSTGKILGGIVGGISGLVLILIMALIFYRIKRCHPSQRGM